MEISWTDRVKSEELQRVKEKRNILHTVKGKKAKWIGHVLYRNCPLKLIKRKLEGKIQVTGRRRRRRKQLLDDVEKRED
jgi:hypothetical protein